jgi:hypothetical protein
VNALPEVVVDDEEEQEDFGDETYLLQSDTDGTIWDGTVDVDAQWTSAIVRGKAAVIIAAAAVLLTTSTVPHGMAAAAEVSGGRSVDDDPLKVPGDVACRRWLRS